MTRNLKMAAVAILTLAGCGSAGPSLEAGEWELAYEITDVKGPADWPPDVIASMKQMKQTVRKCITAEQAAAPTGNTVLIDPPPNCKFGDSTLAGGKISGVGECPANQIMGAIRISMEGHYDSRSYEMVAEAKVDNPGAPMTVNSRTVGRRIGDCPAGKKS